MAAARSMGIDVHVTGYVSPYIEVGFLVRGDEMLRYRADRRALGFLAMHAAMIAVAYVFIDVTPWWVLVPAVAIGAWVGFMTAVITHNTVHAPMWHSGRLNRITQLGLSMLYGNAVSVFVRGHNYSHHQHTQTPKDLMRTTKARFRINGLNQLLFLFIVVPAIERGNKIFIAREREMNSEWYRQFRLERALVWAVTIALFLINWQVALLFVLIPRLVGLWGICGINYVQHDGCEAGHKYNHSRTLVSPVLNWFLCNNGYHGIHHDKPQMHWSLLADAHEAEIHPHIHPGLEEPSMFLYLWRTNVWPGKRMRFDGTPVVLEPLRPDEDWIPDSFEMSERISIGAAGT
jgi:beta-carotene hydroxylase